MKRLMLISFLLHCTFLSFGQLKKFDLSKQILSDYERQGFSTGFGSSGDRQASSFKNQNLKSNSSNYRFGGNFLLGYSLIQNNRSSQFSMGSSVSFGGTRTKDNQTESVSQSFGLNTYHAVSKRFYNKKNLFFGIAGNGSYGFGSNKEESNNSSFESSSSEIRLRISPSVGIGRIEDVTDSWRAYRMLEDLKKFGLLNREPLIDEIMELAKLHTTRQNIRFFDNRFKIIEDIEILADHLADTGLVELDEAKLFTSLYDMWQYGVNANRNSGQRWELSFPLSGYHNQVKANTTDFSELKGYSEIQLSYLKSNPLNLKWQFDWSARIIGGFSDVDLKEESDDIYYLIPRFSANLGYYPNTRTSFFLIPSITYNIRDLDAYEYLGENLHTGYLGIYGRMYYYFSPRTRLEASVSFNDSFSPKYHRCQTNLTRLSFYPGSNFNNAHCIGFNYRIQFSHAFF